MANFSNSQAILYAPAGGDPWKALSGTTHLGVGAHPDDLEFMGWHPILECFDDPTKSFSGVIVSDGRSAPRAGRYAGHDDQAMVEVRRKEQQHAAVTGEYSAMAYLMHSETGSVMAGQFDPLVDDLKIVLAAARPEVVFTHNLADRHPHHLVVCLALLRALRELGPEYRPRRFFGGEVWRGLDWLSTADKLTFNVSHHPNLTAALMGVFDSQIEGGKRYDQATAGRKKANATYHDPLTTDQAEALEYAMDLMPLLEDPDLEPADYVAGLIERFRQEVCYKLRNPGQWK